MREDHDASYAGAKFSSAVQPPEMLCKLDAAGVDEFGAYWAPERDKNSELWRKIKPMQSSHGTSVVRTFRTGEDGQPIDAAFLPYELVTASAGIDLWSVGILTYLLVTGHTLVQSNRDDDFFSGSEMSYIAMWGDEKMDQKLQENMDQKLQAVPDRAARDLIQTLLQPDPSDRGTADDALKHRFFHPESGETGGGADGGAAADDEALVGVSNIVAHQDWLP